MSLGESFNVFLSTTFYDINTTNFILFYLVYFIFFFFLLLYRAYWYYQSLLFTNEYTSDYLKNNIKIYVKLDPACFGAVIPSSGNSLSMLAKVTLC
jgi:hypothetical protein